MNQFGTPPQPPISLQNKIEKKSSKEDVAAIADLIDNLIQTYAKILRTKLEENSVSKEAESIKSKRAQIILSIVANLEKTQIAFLDSFNELGSLELDAISLRSIVTETIATGKKLEQLGF